MEIKISVVVPTYKRPSLLMKCIQSLIGQTFNARHYEIIIISDGPDEATAKVIERWADQTFPLLRFQSLPFNQGPAAARNVGWQCAQANLVAFTDDDCIADPGWLEGLWLAMQNSKTELWAASGKIVVPISSTPTDYELNIAQLESAEFVTANCACTKQALSNVGGFDEAFRMAWREDSDLYFKLLEQHIPVSKLDDAVVIHPVRYARWGVSIREQKKTIFNVLLYKKFPKLYRKKIQPNPPWHYYIIVFSFMLFMISFCLQWKFSAFTSCVLWLSFTSWFILKRLHQTSRATTYVLEMILTSAIIPFLALYWRLYGSLKYRTLFI